MELIRASAMIISGHTKVIEGEDLKQTRMISSSVINRSGHTGKSHKIEPVRAYGPDKSFSDGSKKTLGQDK